MPFQRTWTDEQRAAVVACVLDHKKSHSETARLAAAGSLPGIGSDLEPFAMPAGTIAHYAGAEKRQRGDIERHRNAPAEVMQDNVARLARMLAQEVERIERAARRGRVDLDAVQKAARAGREVYALQELARKAENTGKPAPEQPTEPEQPKGFLDSLAATAV